MPAQRVPIVGGPADGYITTEHRGGGAFQWINAAGHISARRAPGSFAYQWNPSSRTWGFLGHAARECCGGIILPDTDGKPGRCVCGSRTKVP